MVDILTTLVLLNFEVKYFTKVSRLERLDTLSTKTLAKNDMDPLQMAPL
jgi:hypothetical protein